MPLPDAILPPGDPDVAAAELALGLIDGDERASALRRQLADPAFAREVEQWRTHFGALFAAIPERAAPDGLAERIEARLDRSATSSVASPGFWRPLALASSLAAATLAGVLLIRPADNPAPVARPAQPPSAQLIAALALTGKGAPLAAVYDPEAQIVRIPRPLPVPSGRSAQLWAIVNGQPPIPLGLIRIVGATAVADARGQAPIEPGTTLAISIEPVGGSPTGQPTGPIVASGTLSKV
ncbi:MAG: anti-sigma factor [Sphingomonadales bacterium]|nr:anti-sigma factor [Sphingomonadales bacterium]